MGRSLAITGRLADPDGADRFKARGCGLSSFDFPEHSNRLAGQGSQGMIKGFKPIKQTGRVFWRGAFKGRFADADGPDMRRAAIITPFLKPFPAARITHDWQARINQIKPWEQPLPLPVQKA